MLVYKKVKGWSYMKKIEELRKGMREEGIDGLLITNPYNRRYITGFSGTAGVVFITMDEAMLLTDFRYTVQAEEQATGFQIIEHKQPIFKEIAVIAANKNLKVIGFETNDVTYSVFETLQKEINSDLKPVSGLVEKQRLIKTEDEIKIIKAAAEIADAAFDHILSFIKPGIKEIDVSNELEFFMRKQGATSSSFDIIVASGYRSALPHGVASEKVIESGELVTLDFGALYQGYCSDITRTVAMGEISDQLTEIYDTVLAAQIKGMNGIKAGVTSKEADAFTRDHIKACGYGEYFGHSTGHGLGLEVHEGPALSFRSEDVLKEGMIVTVEPGIYVEGVGGCRIEDDTVITTEGNSSLTTAPKELIKLG